MALSFGLKSAVWVAVSVLVSGCSGDVDSEQPGKGGGANLSGGAPAQGGGGGSTPAAHGGTGGTSTTSSGGRQSSGGSTAQGGSSGTGTSGRGATGGATNSGGRAGSGGDSSGGGKSGTGGSSSKGGTSSTGGAATSGGATTGGAAGTGGNSSCNDTCPFANGITWQCKKRFFHGLNQAWVNFASDFGGGSNGIAANSSRINTLFQKYASNGASVIRWWVWPNFSGAGVSFSGGSPSGLAGTSLKDLEALLKLAQDNDLYLQLTLFSFDNFKKDASPNLGSIATNATSRAALVSNVVRPFAKAVESSTYAKRVISWDVCNEPEWAVTGSGVGGDEAFSPNTDCTPITQPQMETLFKDVIAGLRAESKALITIGNAAMKWKNAWMAVDQDFYTFHIYDWVQSYWPYDKTPASYSVSKKPVVMGEFPPEGLNNGSISYGTVMESWYTNGYAGGLPWQDASMIINWSNFKAFADKHACETRY